MKRRQVEGVWYAPYVVRYVTTAGKRRRFTVWCPGSPWLRDTVLRALDDREDVDRSKRVSVRIAG